MSDLEESPNLLKLRTLLDIGVKFRGCSLEVICLSFSRRWSPKLGLTAKPNLGLRRTPSSGQDTFSELYAKQWFDG